MQVFLSLILGPIRSYPSVGYHNLPHFLYAHAAVVSHQPSDVP